MEREREWKIVVILENFLIHAITCWFQHAQVWPEFFIILFCMVSCLVTFSLKLPELEKIGPKVNKNMLL